jgi:hypothetical protein
MRDRRRVSPPVQANVCVGRGRGGERQGYEIKQWERGEERGAGKREGGGEKGGARESVEQTHKMQ